MGIQRGFTNHNTRKMADGATCMADIVQKPPNIYRQAGSATEDLKPAAGCATGENRYIQQQQRCGQVDQVYKARGVYAASVNTVQW